VQPVISLSSTVGRIKSTHFKKEEALEKTMTKVDMDKVILLREKMSTINNEGLFTHSSKPMDFHGYLRTFKHHRRDINLQ